MVLFCVSISQTVEFRPFAFSIYLWWYLNVIRSRENGSTFRHFLGLQFARFHCSGTVEVSTCFADKLCNIPNLCILSSCRMNVNFVYIVRNLRFRDWSCEFHLNSKFQWASWNDLHSDVYIQLVDSRWGSTWSQDDFFPTGVVLYL